MPRINVWIPEDLHRTIKVRLPGLNISAIVQGALAAQLDCRHEQVTCASCATPIDQAAHINAALLDFLKAAVHKVGRLAFEGGTAEGAARVLKELGRSRRLPGVDDVVLPRLTRSRRQALEAQKITALPTEPASRKRHPTARSKTA